LNSSWVTGVVPKVHDPGEFRSAVLEREVGAWLSVEVGSSRAVKKAEIGMLCLQTANVRDWQMTGNWERGYLREERGEEERK
jgi:hypothetical protein